MKKILIILFLFAGTQGFAQKHAHKILGRARLLENTVFGTKDSVTLESLFGKTLAYVHSGGKVETREQAIKGIIHNRSVYEKATDAAPYKLSMRGDSAVVLQEYRAKETKADGTASNLAIMIETVWLKEKKTWKLYRRKASKLHP